MNTETAHSTTAETHLSTGSASAQDTPTPIVAVDAAVPFDNDGCSFSGALVLLRDYDYHAARAGWNGAGQYIFAANGGTFTVQDMVQGDLGPFLVIRTAQGTFVPWLASQADMLADDWTVWPADQLTAGQPDADETAQPA